MDLINLVQNTLDTALNGLNIKVYWTRRLDGVETPNPAEYVIFMLDEENNDVMADGRTITIRSDISVLYYVSESMLRDSAGRARIQNRKRLIREALKTAGFETPRGWSPIGDVDLIGFEVFVLDAAYIEINEGS